MTAIPLQIAAAADSAARFSASITEAVAGAERSHEHLISSLRLPAPPTDDPLGDSGRRFQEFLRVIQQSAAMQASLAASIEASLAPVRQLMSDLPPRTQAALVALGEAGWYFHPDMSLPTVWELHRTISSGDVQAAEELLIAYFQARIDDIAATVEARFPHRSHLIASSIRAYKDGSYDLSIPVLLAQAEGICTDITKKSLFRRESRRPSTAAYVDSMVHDAFKHALLSPLAHALPISASEAERGASFTGLNRHAVMHGEAVDYGTRTNALKAISLLNYVGTVLCD